MLLDGVVESNVSGKGMNSTFNRHVMKKHHVNIVGVMVWWTFQAKELFLFDNIAIGTSYRNLPQSRIYIKPTFFPKTICSLSL